MRPNSGVANSGNSNQMQREPGCLPDFSLLWWLSTACLHLRLCLQEGPLSCKIQHNRSCLSRVNLGSVTSERRRRGFWVRADVTVLLELCKALKPNLEWQSRNSKVKSNPENFCKNIAHSAFTVKVFPLCPEKNLSGNFFCTLPISQLPRSIHWHFLWR